MTALLQQSLHIPCAAARQDAAPPEAERRLLHKRCGASGGAASSRAGVDGTRPEAASPCTRSGFDVRIGCWGTADWGDGRPRPSSCKRMEWNAPSMGFPSANGRARRPSPQCRTCETEADVHAGLCTRVRDAASRRVAVFPMERTRIFNKSRTVIQNYYLVSGFDSSVVPWQGSCSRNG